MRVLARFVSSSKVFDFSLSYIERKLNACSDYYEDCEGCPDVTVCQKGWDNRIFYAKGAEVNETD